jgi:hypothetical protein
MQNKPAPVGARLSDFSQKEITMKSLKSSFSLPMLLAALLAGGGILAATAHALPAGGPEGKPRCEAGARQNHQSREAFRAQHLAALKEKLKLAPGQEAAWESFAASQQPMGHPGMNRQAMHAELDELSTPERLERMSALAEARQARMAQRTEAIKAFYSQLTPEQQKVFDAEAMPQRTHRGHQHGRSV